MEYQVNLREDFYLAIKEISEVVGMSVEETTSVILLQGFNSELVQRTMISILKTKAWMWN